MIIHANSGLIDLRAIRTLGWSVKETANPIGQFGTGSRYAVAVLLRTGHTVVLYRGLDRHEFNVRRVTGRAEKEFDLVTMSHPDGTVEELAFTTHLGGKWQPWMAYRELHSNVLDEKGETAQQPDSVPYIPRADQTAFVVTGEEYERAHASRHTIFLSSTPRYATDTLEVHQGRSEHVYYRGIRVMDLARPSLFTYNLLNACSGLTEDRTLKSESDLSLRVGSMLSTCPDESIVEVGITAPDGTYEHSLAALWSDPPSDTFVKVYTQARRDGRIAQLTSFANGTYLRKHKTLPLPPPIELTRIQRLQLDRAVAFCKRAGWDVDRYEIVVVPHAHGELLGLAQDNKIVLTAKVFDMGVAELVNTLFEEWTHISMGLKDLTREFQTHLMRQLVCAKQELLGEAL